MRRHANNPNGASEATTEVVTCRKLPPYATTEPRADALPCGLVTGVEDASGGSRQQIAACRRAANLS
jgi:hypothetical protein